MSGIGNIGKGREIRTTLDASLRLDSLGLKSVLIEPTVWYAATRVRDPFTGHNRPFNLQNKLFGRLRVRQDISKWGLSYGMGLFVTGKRTFTDVDEVIRFPRIVHLDVFAEQTLFGALVARLEVNNVTDREFGRDRFLFSGGVSGGISDLAQLRHENVGRVVVFSLKTTI